MKEEFIDHDAFYVHKEEKKPNILKTSNFFVLFIK